MNMKRCRYLFLLFLVFQLSCCMFPTQIAPSKEAIALVDQGVLALRDGKLKEAEASFEVALEFGQLAAAYDGIGCVRLLQGEYGEAERYFLHASQIDQSYTHVFSNLALLYQLQGKPEQAERMYAKALDSNPQDFRVRNNFAVFRYAVDGADMTSVLRELRRAQALAPHPLITDNIHNIR